MSRPANAASDRVEQLLVRVVVRLERVLVLAAGRASGPGAAKLVAGRRLLARRVARRRPARLERLHVQLLQLLFNCMSLCRHCRAPATGKLAGKLQRRPARVVVVQLRGQLVQVLVGEIVCGQCELGASRLWQ